MVHGSGLKVKMSMLKMSETEKNNIWEKVFTEKAGFILVVVGFVIIIGAIIAFACFRSWSFSSTINEEIVGQFGDFVGGVVGTLFALVGVVLYYVMKQEPVPAVLLRCSCKDCLYYYK